MKINPENIAKLKEYYRDLVVSKPTMIRNIEVITIVRALDMLGLDVPGINHPE